jgi:phosphoglycolate phosphatase
MSYDLVIFDLDGTLLDTLDDLWASTNYALEQFQFPLRTREEVRQFVGNGIRKLMERAVPNGTDVSTVDQVHRCFLEHYGAHCADHTKPYPGVLELLHLLRQNGIKTAISSNKADGAVQQLRQQYFPGLFDEAAGEKPGVARKPSAEGVEWLLSACGIPKNRAVYVGDSEVDVQTAKNTGIDLIAVSWGFRDRETLRQSGAEKIVVSETELERLLLACRGKL